jgi:hypothetical protein
MVEIRIGILIFIMRSYGVYYLIDQSHELMLDVVD